MKRILKKFCKHGHCIALVGRDASGHCKACDTNIQKKYYIDNKQSFVEYNNRTKECRLEN